MVSVRSRALQTSDDRPALEVAEGHDLPLGVGERAIASRTTASVSAASRRSAGSCSQGVGNDAQLPGYSRIGGGPEPLGVERRLVVVARARGPRERDAPRLPDTLRAGDVHQDAEDPRLQRRALLEAVDARGSRRARCPGPPRRRPLGRHVRQRPCVAAGRRSGRGASRTRTRRRPAAQRRASSSPGSRPRPRPRATSVTIPGPPCTTHRVPGARRRCPSAGE